MGFEYLLILLIVSAVLCSVGFYKYVYFLSVGYGFAVAGIGTTLIVMNIMGIFKGSLLTYILLLLFILYGARLSGFLIYREVKSAAYRKTLKEDAGGAKKLPFFISLAIFISVSVLYVTQTSPVFYRLYNGGKVTALGYIGAAISILAIILESLADREKSEQKKARPEMVATKGLYKIVRCPNYFAEILFWTGIFISGCDIFKSIGQWAIAAFGYICIVFVMFNGAHRLEKRQLKRYGNSAEYHAYADKTPILIPLVPLYHLNNTKK